MSLYTWLGRFLEQRNLKPSEEHPLYAYKCTESEYQELRSIISASVQQAVTGRSVPMFEPVFCLFAAETWRRKHEGGPWAWKTVFDSLSIDVPEHFRIRIWVKKGLSMWKRQILRGPAGHREFLVTIACEGGLPLKLLHREGTKLNEYFRELLDSYHRERTFGTQASELARRHALILPPSLRQEIVFQLGARLIESVVNLQLLIADADDPIAALEAKDPHWRDQLPLPIEDSTVEALLGNLVRQAQALQLDSGSQFRWIRTLFEDKGEWQLSRQLEMPERVTARQIKSWTGWSSVKPRLRILLELASGTEVVALISFVKRTSEDQIYRCEGMRRHGVRLTGEHAMGGVRVAITNNESEKYIPIEGEEELEALPWVFIQKSTNNKWVFVGQGSVRTRANSALVAVDSSEHWHITQSEAEVEYLGSMKAPSRSVYRVSGQTVLGSGDGERCRVVCASEQDSSESYSASGRPWAWCMNDRPVYRGIPSITAVGRDGSRRTIPLHNLEWRPRGPGASMWRNDVRYCAGRIWLRYRNPDDGDVRFRRKMDIVPANLLANYDVGTRDTPGVIWFSDLSAARIRLVNGSVGTVHLVEEGVCVQVPARTEKGSQPIALEFSWPGCASLIVYLPAPLKGAAFLQGGRRLNRDSLVSLDRLNGLRVVAQGPRESESYLLDASIQSHVPIDYELQRLLWLRKDLPALSEGQRQLDLHRIHDDLASQISAVPDVHTMARLTIQDGIGDTLAQVYVARFDAELVLDFEMAEISLAKETLLHLEEGWRDRVTVEIIPLWKPGAPPLELENRDEGENVVWQLPAELEPGPWWVIGRDAGWARFRPIVWVSIGNEELDGTEVRTPLESAIRESNGNTRESMLEDAISNLADDPENPDWELLFDTIRLTKEFPPSSLDVLKVIVRCPEALAMILLRASESEFELVSGMSEQMPFSWYLVPAQCWSTAAGRYYESLRTTLAELDMDNSILWNQFAAFRQRTGNRLPFFNVLCDWMQEAIFDDRQLDGGSLIRLARSNRGALERHIGKLERDLQSRHHSGERWPTGHAVMDLTGNLPVSAHYHHVGRHFRPVRCAPFVAAAIFVQGSHFSNAVLFELRHLRSFDTGWFDQAFTIQTSLDLAHLSVTTS